MIFEAVYNLLVSVVPGWVKRFISRQLEKHFYNRAVIHNLRTVLFLLLSLLTIFCAVSFVVLLIMLGTAVLLPM